MDEFFTTRRFHVVLLSLFAGAGVLLAAIGIASHVDERLDWHNARTGDGRDHAESVTARR